MTSWVSPGICKEIDLIGFYFYLFIYLEAGSVWPRLVLNL
jgi:hypothetical protein